MCRLLEFFQQEPAEEFLLRSLRPFSGDQSQACRVSQLLFLRGRLFEQREDQLRSQRRLPTSQHLHGFDIEAVIIRRDRSMEFF